MVPLPWWCRRYCGGSATTMDLVPHTDSVGCSEVWGGQRGRRGVMVATNTEEVDGQPHPEQDDPEGSRPVEVAGGAASSSRCRCDATGSTRCRNSPSCARPNRCSKLANLFGLNVWLVTGHAEAKAVLADAGDFSNDIRPMIGYDPSKPAEGIGGLGFTDPPDHTRLRRFLTPEFTVRRLSRLTPRIEEVVECQLDLMEAKGPVVDLVARLRLRRTVPGDRRPARRGRSPTASGSASSARPASTCPVVVSGCSARRASRVSSCSRSSPNSGRTR